MSEKRKFEEFHDPDYTQFQPKQPNRTQESPNETSPKPSTSKDSSRPFSADERRTAIRRIVDREFQRELKSKEEELDEINQRLNDAKELLAKVRYAVVHHYYSRKSLLCTAEEMEEVEKMDKESMTHFVSPNDGGKTQLAIHPSLKKLLGKRPIDYNEILKTRAPRQAAKNATEQFSKLIKKPYSLSKSKYVEDKNTDPTDVEDECNMNEELDGSNVEQKIPQYVAPNTIGRDIMQINSARGRNNYRHLLVVGNTSKYIGDEEVETASSVTHKWLVYVASKTEVPVENIISRVRFFLHESYKPNDVAEVCFPPFHLAKRGWGEFPIRVQLHFHDHLFQKPLQIFHTIVLDKKHSGMQTMGAETIVELWLNVPNTIGEGECSKSCTSKAEIEKPSVQECTSEVETPKVDLIQNIKLEKIDTAIETTMHQPSNSTVGISIQKSIPKPIEKPILPQTICDQPLPISLPPAPKIPVSKPTMIALPKILPSLTSSTGKKLIKCVTKDGKVSLIELVQDANNPKIFKMVLPKVVNRAATVQNSPTLKVPNQSNTNVQGQTSLENTGTATNRPQIKIIQSNPLKRLNLMPLPSDPNKKVILIDPKRTQPSPQKSLLKPQVSLLKSSVARSTSSPNKNNGKVITVSNIPGLEHRNINVFLRFDGDAPNSNSLIPASSPRRHDIELEQRFLSTETFVNVTDVVSWLLKKIPLVNAQAAMSEFRDSFPFVVASFAEFHSFLLAKQRSFEWLRAKYISQLIAKHKHLTNFKKWTTKEIVLYGRRFGYTPQSVYTKSHPAPAAEPTDRDMITTELIREHVQNDTISFNTQLRSWLDGVEGTTVKGTRRHFEDEINIVDDDDEAKRKSIEQIKKEKKSRTSHLLLDNRFQDDLMWINDICRRLQVRFEPEQIADGVMHRSSELVIVAALRTFAEDLIRRSCGNKSRTNTAQSSTTEVTSDDVLQTITTVPHFDFLTNKNLGISRSDCK